MKNIREDDPQYVNCSKDFTTRMMEDGKLVDCVRYHCARTSHKPIVYQQRVPVDAEKAKDFKIPVCPYCKSQCVRGGVDDFEGIAIKGPA